MLAYHSHGFEFYCHNTKKALRPWELELGQIVSPLLWTASGFKRYLLEDRIKVNSIFHGVPCFEFLGRLNTTDIVGEKIDEAIAHRRH